MTGKSRVPPGRRSSYPAPTPQPYRQISSSNREDIAHLKTMARVQEGRLAQIEDNLRSLEGQVLEHEMKAESYVTKADFLQFKIDISSTPNQEPERSKKKSSYPPKKMTAKSWVSLISAIITLAIAAMGITTCIYTIDERQKKSDAILLRIEEQLRKSR